MLPAAVPPMGSMPVGASRGPRGHPAACGMNPTAEADAASRPRRAQNAGSRRGCGSRPARGRLGRREAGWGLVEPPVDQQLQADRRSPAGRPPSRSAGIFQQADEEDGGEPHEDHAEHPAGDERPRAWGGPSVRAAAGRPGRWRRGSSRSRTRCRSARSRGRSARTCARRRSAGLPGGSAVGRAADGRAPVGVRRRRPGGMPSAPGSAVSPGLSLPSKKRCWTAT